MTKALFFNASNACLCLILSAASAKAFIESLLLPLLYFCAKDGQIDKNKGETIFEMKLTKRLVAKVKIALTKNANHCEVRISGTYAYPTVIFTGQLYPLDNADVFIGIDKLDQL